MAYGIDVSTLEKFITTPAPREDGGILTTEISSTASYGLQRFFAKEGGEFRAEVPAGREGTIFVEEGSASVNGMELKAHGVILFPPSSSLAVRTAAGACLYFFTGPAMADSASFGAAGKTSDYREKYWGSIETIVSRGYAAKRMFCRAGEYGSMEYHCKKTESYFIHSGRLLARFRAGRAEDRLIEIPAGQAVFIPSGLMHQRGGVEDTVIIEVSSPDDDADSFLVEDGSKTPMPGMVKK